MRPPQFHLKMQRPAVIDGRRLKPGDTLSLDQITRLMRLVEQGAAVPDDGGTELAVRAELRRRAMTKLQRV